MKATILILIGALISAVFCGMLMSEHESYLTSKHQKEVDRLTDLLAKRNGETARANKDSTMWVKK